jgi:UDP-N-acetylglucosamine diphosphorylase/glucosamine-1-phosphate N-acetyltransferase
MSLRINLNDLRSHLKFAPHSLTKPSPYIRCGILTNIERYNLLCPDIQIGFITATHLQDHFPALNQSIDVDATIIPNPELIDHLSALNPNEYITYENRVIATFGEALNEVTYVGAPLVQLSNRWDLFKCNGEVLSLDFFLLTSTKKSQAIPSSCTLIGNPAFLFIEEGAIINASTLNVTTGPIYVAAHAEIMEGSLIRGPFALCEYGQVKMGAKIYGATTIGPHCKVGGEVNNVVFEAYSNKSHDGFLGNGYIGSWCNIGADTNASNLMNNYGIVDVHDYETGKTTSSGEQFVGLHMGDHSKCGINTMFNTGTAIGVGCNVYGPGFFKKHIPSFSFGEPTRLFPYRFDKALEGIESMMSRRGKTLSEGELKILKHIYSFRESF